VDHLFSCLRPATRRPPQTPSRFCSGSPSLTHATDVSSLAHSPRVTPSGGRPPLSLLVSARFQVLFHSPHRGSFHLSLTVLVRYRSPNVFSLGEWTPLLPTGLACPVVLRHKAPSSTGRLPGCHRLWRRFPDAFDFGLACFRLALQPRPACRPVWAPPLSLATTQGIVSFPPGTEMFQFPGFPSYEYVFPIRCAGLAPARVSPFGHLRLLRAHTPRRSFSQCTTSFIGIWHQGIHRTLLVAYPNHLIRRSRCSRVS